MKFNTKCKTWNKNFFNVNIFETVNILHEQWLLIYKTSERIPGREQMICSNYIRLNQTSALSTLRHRGKFSRKSH